MSEKRLYALTDEQAKWLGYYAKVGGYPALDEVLIPLDRDAAVERVARGLMEHWRDIHTNESLGQQRMLAHAALAALLEVA